MTRRWGIAGLAALCGLAMALAPATAKELVYGSWLGANNASNIKTFPPYFDAIKKATNGEIEWKLVPNGQLANGPATADAVKSDLMDAGLEMAPYVPKTLPATNMIFSQSLIGDDLIASVGAMNEVLMFGCDQCKEEFHQNNAVGFGGYGVSPYEFMCRGNPRTLADLKGKKIRGSGGGVNIIEIAGGTPVSMPPNDATTAIERGTLDCVLGGVAWLQSFGYMDVVDTVFNAPMGMGGPPIQMYINRDVWQGMTPEQRKAHIDNAPMLVANELFDSQIAVDETVIAAAKKKGITFIDGGQPFADVMAQRDKIQYKLNVDNATAAGVKDPGKILDFYLASYEKWKKLVADEGLTDKQKFQDALWREVYSKVDPENL
jgi:TRAP-type transport system periplasmic protein